MSNRKPKQNKNKGMITQAQMAELAECHSFLRHELSEAETTVRTRQAHVALVDLTSRLQSSELCEFVLRFLPDRRKSEPIDGGITDADVPF